MALTDWLISYWKFDEGSWTTAFDSVEDNDWSIIGATWTTGKINNWLSFDWVDDYVDMGDFYPVIWSNARSCFARIKTTNSTDNKCIMEWGSHNNSERWQIRLDPTELRLEVAGDWATGTTQLDNGIWHYVWVTYDWSWTLSGAKLWVDWNIELDISSSQSVNTGTNHGIDIWRDPALGNNLYFDWLIDEVWIWNRALTSSEVSELYNNWDWLQYWQPWFWWDVIKRTNIFFRNN